MIHVWGQYLIPSHDGLKHTLVIPSSLSSETAPRYIIVKTRRMVCFTQDFLVEITVLILYFINSKFVFVMTLKLCMWCMLWQHGVKCIKIHRNVLLVHMNEVVKKSTFLQSEKLTHWGRDKMPAIFQTTFSDAFSWMKMYEFWLRFHWRLFLTTFQHWFR